MKDYKTIVENPIFFERNRVFRVYQGGKLFGDFFGDEPIDGNFPEEWIVSDVKALNKEPITEKDGVSKIKDSDIYLDDLIALYKTEILGTRNELGVLVKGLDSGIRLPLQAHPDRIFSEKYFNSSYGKAESWIILATRENACIYLGFKEKMTEEEFVKIIEANETDKHAMDNVLNRIEVKKGDVFFIPAKAVHAIGYGCLILEVQEPTDFTVQPESWCGDYFLSDYEKYLGLSRDIALKCFSYDLHGEKAVQVFRKTPQVQINKEGYLLEALISNADTTCFNVNRHTAKETSFTLQNAPAVCVVTEGEGEIIHADFKKALKKGDYFLIPHCIKGKVSIFSKTSIEVHECLPSKQ